ncbi:MAG: hypothetical protein HFG49_07335 [Lachnospiraceae bacterium]|jgi:hypothetical protein|nr:hypothetical protein [Lachnospiraceae bacterium]
MEECSGMERTAKAEDSRIHDIGLCKLQSMIDVYDKIVLIQLEEKEAITIMNKFEKPDIVNNIDQKILVLSTVEWDKHSSFTYKKIEDEESLALVNLYHTYEFSDKFLVLSNSNTFGTLFNFCDTGLLDLDEVLKSILA